MYCGSCLHENTLAAALLELGEEIVLVPVYTPLRTDEPNVSGRRVYFGGINVTLQQRWSLFRRTPHWLDRWLDHPALLGRLAGRASSVDPARLGQLTVSMLRGEAGHQCKELEKLVAWLQAEVRPEVVHLSNALLLGMARTIAVRCGTPVVCSLAGEDLFLEQLAEPYYQQARELLRERAAEIDAFVAMNHYYANSMAEYLAVDRARVEVIPPGLRLEGHAFRAEKPTGAPRRIGFLARVCPAKGLHVLVEACERLALRQEVPAFELHAAGYLGQADRNYLKQLEQQTATGPLAGRFFYHGELSRPKKLEFLQSLDLFSTPTVYPESKGLPLLEALANGVPVVVPRHGAFPELIEQTGGGLLCEPENSADLAEELALLLSHTDQAEDLGRAGRHAVHQQYGSQTMAQSTLALYRRLVGG